MDIKYYLLKTLFNDKLTSLVDLLIKIKEFYWAVVFNTIVFMYCVCIINVLSLILTHSNITTNIILEMLF